MNHNEYKELLSAFLDGELNETERADVLAHLETCEACQTYLAELNEMHAAFGDLEDIDVPEGFAAGVLARLHEAEKSAWAAKPPKGRTWRAWAGVAACAAVVLLAGSMWRFTHMGKGAGGGNGFSASSGAAPADSAAPETASLQSSTTTASSTPAAAPATAGEPAAFAGGTAAADGEAAEYAAEAAPEEGEAADAPTLRMASGESRKWDEAETTEDAAAASPVLTLSGEGAEDWLMANCFDNMAGDNLYVVSGEALRDLPEGLTLGDGEAVEQWQRLDVDFVTVRAAEMEAAR